MQLLVTQLSKIQFKTNINIKNKKYFKNSIDNIFNFVYYYIKLTFLKEEHMKNFLKIAILFVLFLLIAHHAIYAINMNLSANVANATSTNNSRTTNSNTTFDNDELEDENLEDEDIEDDEIYTNDYRNNTASSNTLSASSYPDTQSATSVTTTYQENSLGLSEYLNIAIIVIGILLILLAIAILIRLKY